MCSSVPACVGGRRGGGGRRKKRNGFAGIERNLPPVNRERCQISGRCQAGGATKIFSSKVEDHHKEHDLQ